MSIAILNEVSSEVRRLAIAGSVVAPGDFRLKKLIEPLKKLGEKAPVFARVADCADQVINATDKTASTALLELAALVNSIMYTQGKTEVDGEFSNLPPSPIKMQKTQTSARILKPLIDALTNTGSGRFEQIKEAHELNLFCDLRLVKPALQALDDPYTEIREYIADKVLPMFGVAIFDELRNTFDLQGKAGHGRRLRVMHRIAPQASRDLVMKALEEGSKDVKLAAIECLGDLEEDLSFLLEQTKARSKEVRAAALLSLSRLSSPEAQNVLLKTLETKDADLLLRPANEIAPKALSAAALEYASKDFENLLESKIKRSINQV